MNDIFLIDLKFYSREIVDKCTLQYYCPTDFHERDLKKEIKRLYNLLKRHKGEWNAD